ncbi:ankyrin repeat domain-containing protein [Streptomyces sp. NPDC047928]|uniref:ankyrin repeat domain-containing protein n=1 Tax=unclassified Streptomyces TaxID=2593676 RepID=UPI00371A1A19
MSPLSPDVAADWRRVRRYAVPRWMIERATERRLAGDWRGACAAAHVDVAFDPSDIAACHGTDVAATLADDLRHLAPDLLRWHLPRVMGGRSTVEPDLTVVLARYGVPGAADAPWLHLTTPPMVQGPQRLTLRCSPLRSAGSGAARPDWTTARHLWDARHAAELRERSGGNAVRSPFCHPDGTPLVTAELPSADPGDDDPAAHAEWVTLLHENGETAAAFAAAGIDLDIDLTTTLTHGWYRVDPEEVLRRRAFALTRLAPEIRLLMRRGAGGRFRVAEDWRTSVLLELTDPGPTGRLRVGIVEREDCAGVPLLPAALWQRLPDIDLVRAGGIAPARLHPLVAGALFPALAVTDGPAGPPGPTPPERVRVRCRGAWHPMESRGGVLTMPHTDEEQRRERALRAFGGAVAGCFAVQEVWASGRGRLPRGLRAQRQELFLRAQHGDTPGVRELLDAGVDPRVRDGSGRGLLHVLHLIDHETLLPRLLAAGLDLEACDHLGRTPLYTAVADRGSAALVRALLAAGARIDVVDGMGLSLDQVIRKYRRSDLAFLRDRVQREHPGVGADWWDEWEYEQDPEEDEEEQEENA